MAYGLEVLGKGETASFQKDEERKQTEALAAQTCADNGVGLAAEPAFGEHRSRDGTHLRGER